MSPDVIIKGQSFKGDPSIVGDSNALGFRWRPGSTKNSILIEDCIIDANGAAEGLKFSYVHDVIVKRCTIIGGYEDCVDIVRGGDIFFEECVFIANKTKHHFTIKCDVSNVEIKNCIFRNNFNRWWDGACVDLGNWGSYNTEFMPTTRDIKITDCTLENISWWKKILTRRIYAENPEVINTDGYNLKIPSFFVKLFWGLRRWQTQ